MEHEEEWHWEIPRFTKERMHQDQWARFIYTVAMRLQELHNRKMDFESKVPVGSYAHREYLQRINNNRIYYKILCGGYNNYEMIRQAWIMH